MDMLTALVAFLLTLAVRLDFPVALALTLLVKLDDTLDVALEDALAEMLAVEFAVALDLT